MKKKKKFVFLKLLLIVFIISACAAGIFIFSIIKDAPDVNDADVRPSGYLSTIYDCDGEILRTLAGAEANRVYVGIDMIPETVQKAFIAIEDERFYKHHGIDIKGIIRAAYKGITTGSFSEGASTITQQLLKNNVFDNWTGEKTFKDRLTRKIQEQYLAIRLEKDHSKEWILENYLNTINLGSGTWGVEAASKRYFGKDVSELNLAESSLLAGITKNPETYSPLKNPEKSVERQHLVLTAMLDQGYISEEEYNEAVSYDIIAEVNSVESDSKDSVFSYYEDTLLLNVKNDLMEQHGYSEEEAWDIIYRGGLVIYSTGDPYLQEICDTEAANADYYSDNEQISLVIMEPSTGAVRALVGGSGTKTASLIFNRATDSIRQPGSAIKIIGEYSAAIEQGATLGTVFSDAPTTYSDGTDVHNSYNEYRGNITLHQAITDSTNTAAVECTKSLGVETVMNEIRSYGITTLTEEDANEALALGGTYNGVTNLEMTAAYNTLANNGIYNKPFYYTKVIDHEGNILLEHESSPVQVVSSSTASLLTGAMQSVHTSGTGMEAYFEGVPLAGKSGSTTNNADTWFIGYSPYYTCGAWEGHDDNSPQESGSHVKNLWKNIMQKANEAYTEDPVNSGDETSEDSVSLLSEDGRASDANVFDSLNDLVSVKICSKCGLLAVDGLCNESAGGDASYDELFIEGTQPKESCSCHVKYSVCSETHMISNTYCKDAQTVVYLKTADAETTDYPYCVEANMVEEKCNVHTFSWYYKNLLKEREEARK